LHLADHQPVEQHAHRGERLLDARRRDLAPPLLDIGGDVKGAGRLERDAPSLAPLEEGPARASIGPPRVRVADVGGEELDVAPARRLAAVGNHPRHDRALRRRDDRTVRVGDRDQGRVAHPPSPSWRSRAISSSSSPGR
jgi:hypothetical protein